MGLVISLASSFGLMRNLPQGEHVQDVSRGATSAGYPATPPQLSPPGAEAKTGWVQRKSTVAPKATKVAQQERFLAELAQQDHLCPQHKATLHSRIITVSLAPLFCFMVTGKIRP